MYYDADFSDRTKAAIATVGSLFVITVSLARVTKGVEVKAWPLFPQ